MIFPVQVSFEAASRLCPPPRADRAIKAENGVRRARSKVNRTNGTDGRWREGVERDETRRDGSGSDATALKEMKEGGEEKEKDGAMKKKGRDLLEASEDGRRGRRSGGEKRECYSSLWIAVCSSKVWRH